MENESASGENLLLKKTFSALKQLHDKQQHKVKVDGDLAHLFPFLDIVKYSICPVLCCPVSYLGIKYTVRFCSGQYKSYLLADELSYPESCRLAVWKHLQTGAWAVVAAAKQGL